MQRSGSLPPTWISAKICALASWVASKHTCQRNSRKRLPNYSYQVPMHLEKSEHGLRHGSKQPWRVGKVCLPTVSIYTNHQGQSKSKIHTLNSHSRLHSLCHNQPGFLKIWVPQPTSRAGFWGVRPATLWCVKFRAFSLQGPRLHQSLWSVYDKGRKRQLYASAFFGLFLDPKDKSQQIWPIKCDRDNSKIECMTQI